MEGRKAVADLLAEAVDGTVDLKRASAFASVRTLHCLLDCRTADVQQAGSKEEIASDAFAVDKASVWEWVPVAASRHKVFVSGSIETCRFA